MGKSLHRFLMETKAELLIRGKKIDEFEKEVALNNVIHALTEALKKIEKEN